MQSDKKFIIIKINFFFFFLDDTHNNNIQNTTCSSAMVYPIGGRVIYIGIKCVFLQ